MKKISGNLILDEEGGRIFLRVTSRVYAGKLDELGIQSSPLSFGRMYVLPRTEEACMLCRNFEEDATECAPFLDAEHPLVEGKYEPMRHQMLTAAFATIHPRCYVLNDPRTGKTGSMCLAMDWMQRQGMVTGGWLIVTTVTTIDGVWTTIGSSNLDRRSVVFNNEVDAVIFGRETAAAARAIFDHDIGRSREITLDTWRRRPFSEKLYEFYARTWEFLM